MKRTIVLVLLLLTIDLSAFGQNSDTSSTVTDEQWQKLLIAVSNEKWKEAVKLSKDFLKKLKADDNRLPRLRYIYLYSSAGNIIGGKMTHDDLINGSKDFVGNKIVMPYRKLTLNCLGTLNFICQTEEENKLTTGAANKAGTSIFAFEYILLEEKFDVASHEGEEASVGGIIQSIQFNPNRSNIWVMRIRVEKGFINLKEQSKSTAQDFGSFGLSRHSLAKVKCLKGWASHVRPI